MESDLSQTPHRRYNPLTGEWVLVSPQRTSRPWLGKQETSPAEGSSDYDPGCYLCPGNRRANGAMNPAYSDTFVFPNDFSALLPDGPEPEVEEHELLRMVPARGECRVICFSPVHRLTLPEMSVAGIRKVIDVWISETAGLGERYPWVQVFENKGEIMGCSNPHPHCQVWAGSWIPNAPARETFCQREYHGRRGTAMLSDYLREELRQNRRVIISNEHWAVVAPFWAVWPFETMVIPRRDVLRLPDLSTDEQWALADIMKRLTARYDNIFEVSFPYTMGWHGAPFDGGDYRGWRLHAHYYPPLLRSATIRKFMVGYEMLAEAQRDITQEQAARMLREMSDVHYRLRENGGGGGEGS